MFNWKTKWNKKPFIYLDDEHGKSREQDPIPPVSVPAQVQAAQAQAAQVQAAQLPQVQDVKKATENSAEDGAEQFQEVGKSKKKNKSKNSPPLIESKGKEQISKTKIKEKENSPTIDIKMKGSSPNKELKGNENQTKENDIDPMKEIKKQETALHYIWFSIYIYIYVI